MRLLTPRGRRAPSLVGDSTEAVRLVEAAVAPQDPPPSAYGLLARLGSCSPRRARRPTERPAREALALVPADEESVLVARIHAGLALFGAAWSRLDVAEAAGAAGLAIARKVGARRRRGWPGQRPRVSSVRPAVTSTRVSGCCGESLAIAREVGNPDDLARPTST